MQFLILGYDGTDKDALQRRLNVRDDHITLGNKMVAEGTMLYGAAILDDNKKMIGSIFICDFNNRDDLDKWLEIEPYVTGNVWKDIKITECKTGPSFEQIFNKKGK